MSKEKSDSITILDQIGRDLAGQLEKKREQIFEEISSYPPPIPACDAQFNYLLEARRNIARELARLNDIVTGAKSENARLESINRLIEESVFLEDDAKRELRSTLKRAP